MKISPKRVAVIFLKANSILGNNRKLSENKTADNTIMPLYGLSENAAVSTLKS